MAEAIEPVIRERVSGDPDIRISGYADNLNTDVRIYRNLNTDNRVYGYTFTPLEMQETEKTVA